jgi:hypothetical protein
MHEILSVYREPDRKDVGDAAPVNTEVPGVGEQGPRPASVPPTDDD